MEDIIRKIHGLLANAESLSELGNQEAADAYIAKAHELQQKYSIDQAMLEARGEKVEKIIQLTIPMPGAHGRRRVHLAHYVALATDCTGYFNRTRPKRTVVRDGAEITVHDYDAPKVYSYVVFGFEKDVAWVETLVTSLNHQLDLALSAATKTKPSWEHGRSFAVAFIEGFAGAISQRLNDAKAAARKEAEAAQAEDRAQQMAHAFATGGEEKVAETQSQGLMSMSLVLADKKKRVEAELKAKVGRLGSSSVSNVGGSGYGEGRKAGKSANLARGSVRGGGKGALGR